MMPYSDRQESVAISFSASGDNTIIAAPSAGRLAIDFVSFMPTAASNITLIKGSTNITGAYPLDAKQTLTYENTIQNREGILGKFVNGQAFKINSSVATQISGYVLYRVIDSH